MNVKQFAACDIVIIFDMQFHGMRYDGFVGSVAVIFHTLQFPRSFTGNFRFSATRYSILEYFSSRFRGWSFVNVRIMSCSLDKWVSNEFRLESNEWPLKKRDLSNEYAPVQIYIYIFRPIRNGDDASLAFEIVRSSFQFNSKPRRIFLENSFPSSFYRFLDSSRD